MPTASYRALHREQLRQYEHNARQQQRQEVIKLYGGKCQSCGRTKIHMELHHIDGSGSQQRREHGGHQQGLFRRILRAGVIDPALSLLCKSCHCTLHRLTAWAGVQQ